MATFHCAVKSGKSGTGGAHADYIEREGKYATKEKDDLEHKQSGNMPDWAESSADFWQAADKHERKNGAVYREFEIALPRELTKEQRLELVREFIAVEIGDKHAYTFAIHNPKAHIEGGEQPHAHIMFSERMRDGIERPAEQYFKRWNAKNPERGGCQKATAVAKTPMERLAELAQLRERFAELQNKHLAKAGHEVRVTHLSLKAQGLTRKPEKDYGLHPSREEVEAIREIRALVKETDGIERAYIQSKEVKHETRPLRNHELRGEIVSLHDVSIRDVAHVTDTEHFTRITPLHLPSAQQIDLREREADSEPVRGMDTESRLKPVKTALEAPETPKAPNPTPEEKQAAVEAWKHFRIAFERVEADRKSAYRDAVAKVTAAEAVRAKYRHIRDCVDVDYAKLGKRPTFLTGKWDAEKARLSAVYLAAKAEEAKAQELKQEHTKQAEKLSISPAPDEQFRAALKALNMPHNEQTAELLKLGRDTFNAIQQEQKQARELAKSQEKPQQREQGMSR